MRDFVNGSVYAILGVGAMFIWVPFFSFLASLIFGHERLILLGLLALPPSVIFSHYTATVLNYIKAPLIFLAFVSLLIYMLVTTF